MAQAKAKVKWSASEKRRLLDYIRDRKANNLKATPADFVKSVVAKLDKAQAARATITIVQEEAAAIVKNAKHNIRHTATTLWSSGPRILNLNHEYLRDVYNAKTIAEISGVGQSGSSTTRKRKSEESIDSQTTRKRTRSTLR